MYHVAVSRSDSLYSYFKYRSGGIESHFYIRYDGTIEQYRDTAYEADAQYHGNSFGSPRKGFLSIETEGMGRGRWTAAQVASLKRLTLWASETHHFPIVKATAWNGHGVGYHRLFSQWNPHGHSCPGPDRVKQFNEVFVPWFRVAAHGNAKQTKGISLATPKEIKELVGAIEDIRIDGLRVLGDKKVRKMHAVLAIMFNQIGDLTNAVTALSKGFPADVQEAVKDALKDSTVQVDVNVKDGTK